VSNGYKWSYVSGTAQEPLVGMTLGQVIDRSAEKFGETEAVVSRHQGSIRKSFLEVKEDSERLAAGFLSIGLEPGDRLGIWGPNSYEWYQTQMAAAKAALVLVNVNPGYKSHELKYCVNKVGMKAIVAARSFKTTDYYKVLCELGPLEDSVPTLKHIILMAPITNTNDNKDEVPTE
jgi:acyl-CoA synthetase (AMP-forming)/AMP-acid ligase II